VENGDVSVFLNERAVVGLTVEARGPFGQFCFDEAKHNRILLIAGGSGITPMISMLRHIDDCCLETDVTLIYGVRRGEDVLFKQELERLKTRLENFRLVLVLSRPDPGWPGARGHITRELIAANAPKLDMTDVFLCGPPAFSEAALEILSSLGWTPLGPKTQMKDSSLAQDCDLLLHLCLVLALRSSRVEPHYPNLLPSTHAGTAVLLLRRRPPG